MGAPSKESRPKSEFDQTTPTIHQPPDGMPVSVKGPGGEFNWDHMSGTWDHTSPARDFFGSVAGSEQRLTWIMENSFHWNAPAKAIEQAPATKGPPAGMPTAYKGAVGGTYTWNEAKQKYAHGSNEMYDKSTVLRFRSGPVQGSW